MLLLFALLLAACSPSAAPTGSPETSVPEETGKEPGPKPAGTEMETAPAETAAPEDMPKETPEDVPEEAQEETSIVYAATVEEFLKALRPNTEIHLTGRSYNLSRVFGYGNFGGDHYDWEGGYDGFELVISGLKNLSIIADKAGTEIVTDPRYAAVLHFVDCSDVKLSGFTAGHSEGAGYCTGSVLFFTDCERVEVKECELYGCGTYGLELVRSNKVQCLDSVIRDCSYGTVSAINSSAFVMDGCTVYGIQDYNGCFWFNGCNGCAILNSLIRNCEGESLVWSDYSRVFLGGCEVRGNTFTGMFHASLYPITVESCAFQNNSTSGWYFSEWSESLPVVNSDGQTWTDGDLSGMTVSGEVNWTPPEPEQPDTAPVEPSEDGLIHVSNMDELLASLAPGASIYLEDGVYDLSTAAGFGSYSGKYYYWMTCYDGPGLVIRDIEGLNITAGGPHRASIVSVPRYADVISFENCSDISLSNFTAGHTQAVGECAGGVLNFMKSNGITIQDCSLYGCGVYGISAYNSGKLTVRYTEIHDCSYGAVFLTDCDDVSLEHCNIHDIPGATYQIYDCRNATVDGRKLPEGNSF